MNATNTNTEPSAAPRAHSKEVGLDELIFTMSWEDGDLDRAVFAPLGKGARIATVASGGCNALTFLLDDPAEVFAFDYNPTQVYVVELKRASFLALTHPEILELFGVRPSRQRASLLARLEPYLSPEAAVYFTQLPWLVTSGLLGGGRYERFVGWFRVMLRTVQGARTVDALFAERDATERRRFYEERWDGSVWRLLFRAFFNKTVLASRGLSADYFHFACGESFAEAFARRTKRALTDLAPRDNPFVAQYVLGRYLDEEHLPEYLRPENYDILRERVPRLTVQTADVRHLADRFPAGRFDALCLSNVFELMSEDETKPTLARVADVLAVDGRMTLRNLMVPRAVAPETLALVLNAEEGAALHDRDRAFVYRSFQSYRRAARGADTRSPMNGKPSAPRDAARRSAHRLILGQAITGELVAIENYARMIPLARSTEDKLALLEEAVQERAHIRILHGLCKVLDLGLIEGVVFDPYWSRVRAAMDEIVARSDLDAARFVQDFILESYAVTLYRAVLPYVEPVFRRKLEAIANDEHVHLVSGISAFAQILTSDRARAFGILDFGHTRVAKVLAEWIAPSECRPLCGVCGTLGDRCGKPLLQEIQLDTSRLAADFADVYGSALRDAGLGSVKALRYVAELVP